MTTSPGDAGSRPKLLVTRLFLPEVNEHLRQAFDSWGAREQAWAGEESVAAANGADGLLVTLAERLDAATIAALPDSVRAIATASIGLDHIDLTETGRRGIAVINAPESGGTSTAETALLLILAVAPRLTEAQGEVRAGQWRGWHPTRLLGFELDGKRLGIFGMGRIGRLVARRARAFGLQVHYHGRTRLPPDLEAGAIFHDDVRSLFASSDILSLHAPATPATRHVLNATAIGQLPHGAVVINTARGDLVDDDALIAALRSGRLAGAGLDVYAGEPQLDRRYLDLANTVLLPHIGTATREARRDMTFHVVHALERQLAVGHAVAA